MYKFSTFESTYLKSHVAVPLFPKIMVISKSPMSVKLFRKLKAFSPWTTFEPVRKVSKKMKTHLLDIAGCGMAGG